ncbi:putative LETM1-like protein [Babesia divergens]|uniref:LETM1-like protein n=1 Tax=Babesia divergens TaxID=32595 RepID=A0AAD9LIY8_BABDI|nr:putative LETM1-like protein [Babesia divergens]
MWKGVVHLDASAVNLQGKRSLLKSSARRSHTVTPTVSSYQYGRVFDGYNTIGDCCRDAPSFPILGRLPYRGDCARETPSSPANCFLMHSITNYGMYSGNRGIGRCLNSDLQVLLPLHGINRLYCSGAHGRYLPKCNTDSIRHVSTTGSFSYGNRPSYGAPTYKDGTAYSVCANDVLPYSGGFSNNVNRVHQNYGKFTKPYGMYYSAPFQRNFSMFGGPGKKGVQNVSSADMFSISKRHSSTRSIVRLSFSVVKWAVVLPFRLGKWAVHLFSLTFRMVTHLMRLSARAAVVARVSGVSGIFKSIIDGVKHTVHWCKTGFRLYFANVKVSYYILLKRLKGHPMRYNERKLLMKTLNDALKMVPFSFFIIVPFAEFLLPVAIRLFPQMLPSTFRTDNSKSDDYLQKKLLAKKELAQFFQELVQERTNQILQEELDSSLKTKMEALKDFQERILNKEDLDINPFLSCNELLVFSKIFKKEFKLDQMNLETLKVMCKLLGITPFSMRTHVVLQLRHHLLKIQREDRLILWEGVDSLTTEELQEACRDRAMKFYNVTKEQLQQQLKQWLDLSSMPEISPILLLWSRCITMTHEPMAIKADNEVKPEADAHPAEVAGPTVDAVCKEPCEPAKPAKIAEKFAEEVTTAQKASSFSIVQAVTAAAEIDAQKLLNREERLEELSLKAEELKSIIEGNIQETEEEIADGAVPFDDPKREELMMELHGCEERYMQLNQGEHVILHTHEINKLLPLSKQEILTRHEELLSALHLQRQISDLQHNQLTEMFMFLLKVSEDSNVGKPFDFKDSVNDLVKAARQEMEKIEELTHQFDKHNLTYD